MMEVAKENVRQEAHLLIFPASVQGHINAMLPLADALSFVGSLRVSFLNTDHNHRLLSFFSLSQYSGFSLRPNLRFLSIPDGLSDDKPRLAYQLTELLHSFRTHSMDSFRTLLLSGGNKDSDDWLPVTCIIVDGLMSYFMDEAQALGIPALAFRTISASSLWIYLQIPQMIEAGELPFPADADLDEHIKSVLAMEGFLRRRDLPNMCRKAAKADDKELQLFTNFAASGMRSKGLIVNTSDSLEAPILSQIESLFPTTYAVGPLHALVESITSSSISASLLAEDRSALNWLDAQPFRSVVYVSFGSLARLTQEEFLEFWHGLVNSGHRFLWVVRPDLVAEGTALVEMAGLEERVRLVAWAPQQEVLRHRAVGCFITHSGWNSTLESAAAGVPMVCWPWAWDQLVNSRLVGEVWKVGLDMKDVCKREMVESMVREAMEGEKAEELRRRATEMAVEIGRSVGEGGDARLNSERLLRDILSLSLCAAL
ncbi:hypothetical protein M5K25_013314 [Dendrobium thyrsiflorum]|uniref:Glycosyltransferase n=1 Tax=Dendrobium thyrsiflorum TaxID=117978 RepID=A0ABD0UT57_DENTH